MTQIYIADDHKIVRQGLRKILEEDAEFHVAGEAGSVQELETALGRSNGTAVVLLDVSMPGTSGIEALPKLRTRHPKARFLMLSVYPEEQYALRALKSGASGYLSKECAGDQLLSAVRAVGQGQKYVSPRTAQILAQCAFSSDSQPKHLELSEREFQVLHLIYDGVAAKEIAARLNLSNKSVCTYRRRILDKLELKTNAELIRYCIEQKLFV